MCTIQTKFVVKITAKQLNSIKSLFPNLPAAC